MHGKLVADKHHKHDFVKVMQLAYLPNMHSRCLPKMRQLGVCTMALHVLPFLILTFHGWSSTEAGHMNLRVAACLEGAWSLKKLTNA